MTALHEHWMRRAVAEAKANLAQGEAPIAALIVRQDKLLAIGYNRKTSKQASCAHAELEAILAASDRIGREAKDCVIYVTLVQYFTSSTTMMDTTYRVSHA